MKTHRKGGDYHRKNGGGSMGKNRGGQGPQVSTGVPGNIRRARGQESRIILENHLKEKS